MNEGASCPCCGNPDTRRLRYSKWTGFLGPLIFKQFTCARCETTFAIKGTRSRRVVSWSVFVLSIVAIGVGVIYISPTWPDPQVLDAPQIRAGLVSRINELVSLDSGENIQYFYSDSDVYGDISDGFYMLTDRRLILYSTAHILGTSGSRLLVPFSAIDAVDTHFSNTPGEDTVIEVVLADGDMLYFPASTENGGDRRMFDYLSRMVEMAQTR